MTIEIPEGTLKVRHGDYVIYNVNYLLEHLPQEIYLLEDCRRMKKRMQQNIWKERKDS